MAAEAAEAPQRLTTARSRAGGRPLVVIVTTHWSGEGELEEEATTATRLIAGALSRRAEVEIIHVCAPPMPLVTLTDSVFTVHRIPLHGARPLRSGLLRAALVEFDGGRRIPEVIGTELEEYEGEASDVPRLIAALRPDAVVLAGHRQPYDPSAFDPLPGARRPRVIFLPYLADAARLRVGTVARICDQADVVGVAHEGERRAVVEAFPERDPADVVPLDLALPLNRSATTQRLFGVRFFGTYVLLIRSFPPGGARFERSVTHEVLRSVLGTVSVAEVDGETWRVSDAENTLELPVNPTRVNLWRLMAHAIATVDLRPPGPIGREAIESMLLGTAVVVPEPSAAMEHVASANGGLWYRDPGELFDATRALMRRSLRNRLAAQGHEYAEAHHGQMDDFVARTARLVLGDGLLSARNGGARITS